MIKCEICDREIASIRSLANHLRYNHQDFSVKDYYDKFFKRDDKEGICRECGKETRFYSVTAGYSTFCSKQCANRNNDKNTKARLTKDSTLEYPEYRVLQVTEPQLIQQCGYGVWNCGYAVLTKSSE